jgi:hypothetical protein
LICELSEQSLGGLKSEFAPCCHGFVFLSRSEELKFQLRVATAELLLSVPMIPCPDEAGITTIRKIKPVDGSSRDIAEVLTSGGVTSRIQPLFYKVGPHISSL